MKGQDVVKTTYITPKHSGKYGVLSRKVNSIRMDVAGIDGLVNQFIMLGEDAIFRLSEPSVRAAQVVANKAKSYAPVDDGELKAGIVVRKPGKPTKYGHRAYQIFARVTLTKKARHGIPVELGHKMSGRFAGRKTASGSDRVEARPFLRPAADIEKSRVSAIIIEAMDDVIWEAKNK